MFKFHKYMCVFASPPSLADQKFARYMQGVAAALGFNRHYY